MKKIIERLERVLRIIPSITVDNWISSDARAKVRSLTEEAITELKKPTVEINTLDFGELKDMLKDVYCCITGEVEGDDKDENYKPCHTLDYLERARHHLDYILDYSGDDKPRWETPEQREKRTGEAWPDNGAVYALVELLHGELLWEVMSHDTAKTAANYIVCAAEAGPPPNNWQPEE
jgi:hypothetical protein